MPNWCQNTLSIFHEDPEMIDAIQEEVSKMDRCELFNSLIPRPESQEEYWYEWNIANWGTKWDASIFDYERIDDNTISIVFDSAWSPPTRAYETLYEKGYGIDAHYLEEGMGFVGRYFNGEDEEHNLDYSLSKEECFKYIPQECIDHWGLDTQWEDNREFYEGENNDDGNEQVH